jgi:phage shock protein PspC (stress-responsive transcriptional regulator)
MQRVISINLNGNAYQLDEVAYNALFAYLDGAETQLKDNPDRAEIMADLEQAVAEKCSTYLGPHKTVVTAAEVDRIIAQMGPVDGGGGSTQGAPGTPGNTDGSNAGGGGAPGESDKATSEPGTGAREKARTDPHGGARRLYQIREGAMISGVCNGLAVYFAIDVTLVRIIFVLLAILTHGAAIGVYVLMMFLIPHASTPDERAAAHGIHFSAQEVIDQAKKNIEQFSKDFGKHDWGAHWRQRREWRRHHRSTMWNPPGPPPPPGLGAPLGPGWPGTMGPLYGLLWAGLFVTLIVAIASLFDSGLVFGWPFFPGLPRWISLFVLIALFQLVVMPLRIARRATYAAWYGPYSGWSVMWDWFMWVALMLVGLWFADRYIPGVHEFFLDLNFGPVSRLR